MSDPRGAPSLTELEAILRACGTDLRYPSTPDVAGRLRGLLTDGHARAVLDGGNGSLSRESRVTRAPLSIDNPPLRASKRWNWMHEGAKLAVAGAAFGLVALVLVLVLRSPAADPAPGVAQPASPALAASPAAHTATPSATSAPTATSNSLEPTATVGVGEPFALPFFVGGNGEEATLLRVAEPPVITLDEARQVLEAAGLTYARQTEWQGQPVMAQGWYGLGSLGHPDSAGWVGPLNLTLSTGETLPYVEDRLIWLLGYIVGPSGSQTAYAIDAVTQTVLLTWSLSPPPGNPSGVVNPCQGDPLDAQGALWEQIVRVSRGTLLPLLRPATLPDGVDVHASNVDNFEPGLVTLSYCGPDKRVDLRIGAVLDPQPEKHTEVRQVVVRGQPATLHIVRGARGLEGIRLWWQEPGSWIPSRPVDGSDAPRDYVPYFVWTVGMTPEETIAFANALTQVPQAGAPLTSDDLLQYCPPGPGLGTGSTLHVMAADGSNVRKYSLDLSFYSSFPDWSPDGARIAYSGASDPPGQFSIWVMNADGTDARRIVTGERGFQYPIWSPDSRQIAFASQGVDVNDSDIFVANADGTDLRQLTDSAGREESPRWSPDGAHIAFVTDRDGNPDIYTMNADGSEQRNLTNNPAGDGLIAWLPDGQLVFVTDREQLAGGYPAIYIMNADGSGQRSLTGIFQAGDEQPSWSPDGSRIVFERAGDIWTMQSDGTQRQNLTWSRPDEASPRWSVDGQEILFQSDLEAWSTTVTASEQTPGRIKLTSGAGAQTGELGPWCRQTTTSEGQETTWDDALAVSFARDAVRVDENAPLTFDVTGAGTPTAITTTAYSYTGAQDSGKLLDGVALVRPCAKPGDYQECVSTVLSVMPSRLIDVDLGLSPGEYIIVVTMTFEDGGVRGFTEQGFHVEVTPGG